MVECAARSSPTRRVRPEVGCCTATGSTPESGTSHTLVFTAHHLAQLFFLFFEDARVKKPALPFCLFVHSQYLRHCVLSLQRQDNQAVPLTYHFRSPTTRRRLITLICHIAALCNQAKWVSQSSFAGCPSGIRLSRKSLRITGSRSLTASMYANFGNT